MIRCPKCGESYYQLDYTIRTAVNYPPIYKNGALINSDSNYEVMHCTCCNCGEHFTYQPGANNGICEHWHPETDGTAVCWGTIDSAPCICGGDRSKCDFKRRYGMGFNAYRMIAMIFNLCIIAGIWFALDGSVILKIVGSIGWLRDSLFIFNDLIGDKNEN